jgi:hypothetical protein
MGCWQTDSNHSTSVDVWSVCTQVQNPIEQLNMASCKYGSYI